MKKLYFISSMLLCAFVYSNFSNQPSKKVNSQNGSERAEIVLSLPVNSQEKYKKLKSRVHLTVLIPQDFGSVLPIDQVINANMLEFIPKTDKSVDAWSEIITIQKYIDRSIISSQLTNYIQQSIQKQVQQPMIIESINQEHSNYSESFFVMTYVNRGRKEILAGKYFSGPCDCSGVQYTIILSDGMTEKKAMSKIKNFMNQNIALVRF